MRTTMFGSTTTAVMLSAWLATALAATALAANTPAPLTVPLAVPAGWQLVWSDEFDTDGLPDPTRWDYDTAFNRQGWFNHERQYYARARLENSRVAGGKLIITARKEALADLPDHGGQPYSSARLFTRGLASWTTGFFEVRARLPCGGGTWPAIWMLGSRGSWPGDGEIDIMEHVGNKRGEILGSIYTGAQNWPMNTPNSKAIRVDDACHAFHNYQLLWTPDQLVIGVDGRPYNSLRKGGDGDYRQWPFASPQYLLLNLAIGGDLGGAVDDASLPQQLEIDYVRVFQAPARAAATVASPPKQPAASSQSQ
ncbi:glycoside hydrolase family 16 protein [Massilia sp. DWR3-1-1]|uniref:glycoside hydrolase family 16 protein n=1 Tax=Massilia sp. DWR3-1-1 TaxID=2804559 RepID=UPI003CF99674